MKPLGWDESDDNNGGDDPENPGRLDPDDDDTAAAVEDSVTPAVPRMLLVLATVLERLVARNDQVGSDLGSGSKLEAFHGVRAPSISIAKYLERIYRYTSCSPSCFVVGYVYMDRLVHRHPGSPFVSLNVHRLLVTSVMVASKVLDDVHYNNAFYARVGGVSNEELNRLELELLFLLDFGVVVTARVFESYCMHLEKEMLYYSAERNIEKLPTLLLENEEEGLLERL